MAVTEKAKHFGKSITNIPGGYVIEEILAGIAANNPRHFAMVPGKNGESKSYWKLVKLVTKVRSGNLTELICTLEKNPEVDKDPFYVKDEVEFTVPVDQISSIQNGAEEYFKEIYIGTTETDGRVEATWEADTFIVAEDGSTGDKYIVKFEYKMLLPQKK